MNLWNKNDTFTDAISKIRLIKKEELKKLDSILSTLSTVSGFQTSEITGKSRKLELVSVRQIYCYLAEKTINSLQEIGNVCKMKHSSIIHNNKVITTILSQNFKDTKSIYVKEILEKYDKAVSGNIN